MEILFDDSDILAINKPAGIAVHHDGRDQSPAITDWVIKKFPKTKGVGEPLILSDGTEVPRPGIVHRLDKDTSGVLLVAKTAYGYKCLKSQFMNREIKKTYHAFVYGKPRDERGMVDRPIGRSTTDIRRWATGAKARGELREAVTRYKVLGSASGVSLLEVWPLTGRTHQIRVHMASIGHPVVGDSLYAPRRPMLLGFERLALHASRTTFTDLSGEIREVSAPFPQDFEFAQRGFM